jgi:hypothetical protein
MFPSSDRQIPRRNAGVSSLHVAFGTTQDRRVSFTPHVSPPFYMFTYTDADTIDRSAEKETTYRSRGILGNREGYPASDRHQTRANQRERRGRRGELDSTRKTTTTTSAGGHSGQFAGAEEWALTRIRTDLREHPGRARGHPVHAAPNYLPEHPVTGGVRRRGAARTATRARTVVGGQQETRAAAVTRRATTTGSQENASASASPDPLWRSPWCARTRVARPVARTDVRGTDRWVWRCRRGSRVVRAAVVSRRVRVR